MFNPSKIDSCCHKSIQQLIFDIVKTIRRICDKSEYYRLRNTKEIAMQIDIFKIIQYLRFFRIHVVCPESRRIQ